MVEAAYNVIEITTPAAKLGWRVKQSMAEFTLHPKQLFWKRLAVPSNCQHGQWQFMPNIFPVNTFGTEDKFFKTICEFKVVLVFLQENQHKEENKVQ